MPDRDRSDPNAPCDHAIRRHELKISSSADVSAVGWAEALADIDQAQQGHMTTYIRPLAQASRPSSVNDQSPAITLQRRRDLDRTAKVNVYNEWNRQPPGGTQTPPFSPIFVIEIDHRIGAA
ncbi:hypothetical protein AB0J63_01380 [Streptosporangium canum]|uniref:hypothetical protein n=1 Tax=Streptosporangium canum TaxID=324952 RepID=UPI00343209C5